MSRISPKSGLLIAIPKKARIRDIGCPASVSSMVEIVDWIQKALCFRGPLRSSILLELWFLPSVSKKRRIGDLRGPLSVRAILSMLRIVNWIQKGLCYCLPRRYTIFRDLGRLITVSKNSRIVYLGGRLNGRITQNTRISRCLGEGT